MTHRILILLLLAFFSQGIQAQNCAINFWTGFAFPNGGIVLGVYPDTSTTGIAETYAWSNGISDTSAIYVNQPGNYCVTVTFDDGCTAANCYTYTPSCSVGISAIPEDGLLSAGTWGVPPYSFLWSTGATTSTIEPAVAGTYSVTFTDAAGCTSTNSFVVDGQDSCVLLIDKKQFGNNQTILSVGAYDASGNTATYLWSTGATTPTVTVPSGTYCVTVTLPNCSFTRCLLAQHATCSAQIVIDTVAQTATAVPGGSGTAPYSYAWSDGSTSASIALPANWTEICVSVTDANGCVGIDCADNTQYPCGIVAYVYPDSSGSFAAYAYASGGVPPYAYQWSDGSTTPGIFPVSGPAVYCVTLTDAAGCTSSDCVDVPGPVCAATIHADWNQQQNTLELTASTNASDPVYQWSNGASTPGITVTEPGNYCVTVTGADGCTGAECFNFSNDNQLYVSIVFADSLDDISAEIFIIRYDTAQGGMLTAIDTVLTNADGYVYITGLPAGEYLVKAALLPGSNMYDQYLPTYYAPALFWNEATPVRLLGNYTDNSYVHINMIQGQNPGGPGFIGGLVSQGANLQSGVGTPENSDEPMTGAQVILRTTDGTPVAARRTGTDGTFTFDGLPWGSYIVSTDLPGIDPQHQTVTIGPDQPSVTGLAFTVKITTSTTAALLSGAQPLRLRPNPATDRVMLEAPEGLFELILTDGQGRQVRRVQVQGPNVEIDVLSLPAGLYFIHLQNGRYSAASKLIKQ